MRIPVMVWIHGGGYFYGSGSDGNHRPDYLLAKEVIVVSINYRLGAFEGDDGTEKHKMSHTLPVIMTLFPLLIGFLKLGHETVSGNQGLKDQTAALKWVKENIHVFGGDPENITVFGNSTGAVSVHLLMLSPLSKDSSENTLKLIYQDLEYHVRNARNLQDPVKMAQLMERIKQWYFNGKPCTENSILSIIQCMSDIYINIPTTEFVNSRRKKKEAVTYFYKFSYVGSQITTKHMLGRKVPMIGAAHDDESSYLFYIPKYKVNDPQPPVIGTRDRKVVEALTSMWTNFAKSGNLTPASDQNVTATWLPATADALNYLEINDALQCAKISDFTNIFQESDE
ncbi:Para-nitrobenzyl esterase [Ooceraea biroi]|uniref:Carboxylic ester hydrolase n=1 Tax=Ooceraea biroi TaxID=2015173 RepID=A0A026VWQ6_OOCBI|nr:Para-nitrobenzyl esterase [Ooceraea biroi]